MERFNNRQIVLEKVRVHNLKNISLSLKSGSFIVFTGVSGSGKSSLAFDTIYAEGQRRYTQSLSHYYQQFIKQLPKPDAEKIENLSPTIAIEQKSVVKNPRSTVGTITTIYDYLRVLYAKIAIAHCPISHKIVTPQSAEKIIEQIQKKFSHKKILVLAPFIKDKKGSLKDEIKLLQHRGFIRLKIDGKIFSIDEIPALDPKQAHSIDIIIDRIINDDNKRIAEAVSQGLDIGRGFVIITDSETSQDFFFSTHGYCHKSKKYYPTLQASDFSFNHPSGMCETCQGLGEIFSFDFDKIICPDLSLAQDCCIIAPHYDTVRYGNIYRNLARLYEFDVDTPWKKLPKKAQNIFLYGTKKKWIRVYFTHPRKKSRWIEYISWKGVINEAMFRLNEAKSDIYRKKMQKLMKHDSCPDCKKSRLKPYPSAATLSNKTIYDITQMTIDKTLNFFYTLSLSKEQKIIGDDLIKEICKRLTFLLDVGLNYLSLNRTSPTLSGGECQRVRLAAQIGCGLIGTTYILDEPSIGLHPFDHAKLIDSLSSLQKKNNTIIVVEHDRDTIAHADTIVDIGPKAGKKGGEIIAHGPLETILNEPKSLTGQYLCGKRKLPERKKYRRATKFFSLFGTSHNNLKSLNISFPLQTFIGITGVSGSGKSSLISDTLYPLLSNHLSKTDYPCGQYKKIEGIEHIDKVIFVDQSPIGRTYRSNPVTYCKIFADIRDLFSSLKESLIKGFSSGHFSFNVREGTCPYCKGVGQIKIDMDFMEDTWIECFQCKGKRFDPDILQIEYKNKNIFDVLEMEVSQAIEFFQDIPKIRKKLAMLAKVGLDYIHLGQSATTLSGGEAQRIKLAKELLKPSTGKTFYILDEPTTGLHYYDMEKLLLILQELVDKKNTVLVIEHNMDFIKSADWIIDLGPGAGEKGGQIVSQNTPKKLSSLKTSTGLSLLDVFQPLTIKKKYAKKTKKKNLDILIEEAHQNNLKNISLKIPHNKISVLTGPSGSGKSSLAFETIYAEGQRRYIDTLPPYAKQFLKQMPKPKVKKIDNLSPCIAIEQKNRIINPRSTVGTLTETYDYLRIIYSHLGKAYCPETKEEIKTISKKYVLNKTLSLPDNQRLIILAPLKPPKKELFQQLLDDLNRKGFLRIRLNGNYFEIDQEISYDDHFKNELYLVIDRLEAKKNNQERIYEALCLAAKIGNNVLVVNIDKKDLYYNLSFAVESTGKSYPHITPQSFSFNSEQGMCLECQGIGTIYGADIRNIESLQTLSIIDIIDKVLIDRTGRVLKLIYAYFSKKGIDIYTPLFELDSSYQHLFLFGDKDLYKNKKGFSFRWRGLNNILAYRAKHAKHYIRFFLLPHMKEKTCPECSGNRLNPLARHVKINGMTIVDLSALSIDKTLSFCKKLASNQKTNSFLKESFSHLITKLTYLCQLGVDYLSLDRSCPSLSSGELQRIRLASQLGLSLTSCTYILDEPTIGLHPYNIDLLTDALKKLKKLGNTLILVEHDPLCIKHADLIIDIGPQGGEKGGYLLTQGSFNAIKKDKRSITGQYLSGKKTIPLNTKQKQFDQWISIKKASLHNLKNIDVKIPTNALTALCGVSGSGKSTLLFDILKVGCKKSIQQQLTTIDLNVATIEFPHLFSQIICLDQNPIGQTRRSDICSYTGILILLRSFFSSLPQAKTKGLKPRHFSYNHKRGMCKTCRGIGYKMVQLQYLPPVKVTCDSCNGYKLNPISLSIQYKGKNLGQILNLTVDEAIDFLSSFTRIVKKLQTIASVGLGYLRLGQEIASLSGGEAQRIRLSRELAKRKSQNTLYLFDEPSRGLHYEDIAHLLSLFYKLAEKNNTLILIEHNIDIISRCDYLIDLGPEGGEKGGQLLAQGTVDEVKKNKRSITSRYLY